MVHAVFCLVSALTIMAAVVSLAYAGEVPKGDENMAPNMTPNITLTPKEASHRMRPGMPPKM